ncbi:MAG: hypothetical protein AAF495_00665 [Pseudomonadota bacterium]
MTDLPKADVSPEKEPDISFLCDPALEAHLPPPERAGRFLPEWFRRLEREMGLPTASGLTAMTVKGCRPVTDGFTLGWIIPLALDVRIVTDPLGNVIELDWDKDFGFQPVERHHPAQVGYPNPPFDWRQPLKWMNPWRLVVPDGYSMLFTHPLNHFELPFQCFSGLVDCDRFLPTVNFPFALTGVSADITVPRGTPIIQLIPIKRDGLLKSHMARASTEEEAAEQAAAHHRKHNEESVYAREWRVRK